MKKLTRISLITLSVVFWAVAIYVAFGREKYSEESDPSGEYVATTYVRVRDKLQPSMPGQGSDLPCIVSIKGKDGTAFGEIPVPMIQVAGIDWAASGAEIKLVGEWDFAKKTCYYWSEDGNTQIFVKN